MMAYKEPLKAHCKPRDLERAVAYCLNSLNYLNRNFNVKNMFCRNCTENKKINYIFHRIKLFNDFFISSLFRNLKMT